jgi:hypothetical protein
MSNKPSNVRRFTVDDFKSADRIERIFIWMMEPEKFILNPRDEIYMDELKQAYIIMTEEMEEVRRMKKLKQLWPEHRPVQLMKLMDDSESLFGRFRKMNKDFQDKLVRERLMGMLQDLIEVPKENRTKDYYKTRIDLEKLIMQLNEKIKEEENKEADLGIPPVFFSADTKFLHAEKIDYEEE